MPLASFWKGKLLELRNGLLIHPQSQSKWKSVWRLGTITLMAHRIPRTSKLRSDVLTAGFILEIGQWESNGLPSVILGGPFSKKGVQERGDQIQIHSAFWDFWHSTWVGLVGRFAAILEHSGQLRKPRLQLYRRIPDVCLVKWWYSKRP